MDTDHIAAPTETIDTNNTQHIRYLQQIVTGTIIICIVFGLGDIAGYLLVRAVAFLWLGGTTVLLLSVSFLVGRELDRGNIQHGATIFCSALILLLLTYGIVSPPIIPTLIAGITIPITIALTYLRRRWIVGLTIATLLSTTLMMVNAGWPLIRIPIETPPQVAIDLLLATAVPSVVGLNLLVLWQFASRLQASLANARTANTQLASIQATLEQQVQERTAELLSALTDVQAHSERQAQLLTTLANQQTTIRTLSVPVLPISNQVLVLPLVGNLDEERLELLQQRALSAIEHSSVRHLLLDITGVTVVDTQVAQGLIATIQSAQLLGTEAILVGIRPEVAQTIVGLGIALDRLRTFRDIQGALAVLKN